MSALTQGLRTNLGRWQTWAGFGAAAVVLFGVAPTVLSDFRLSLLGKFLCFAIVAVGIAAFLYTRRGQPKKLLDRKVEPLAAKQIWTAIPLVVAVAVALAFMPLPHQLSATMISRSAPYDLTPGMRLVPPPGWSITGEQQYT
ncbi:hypothetical protein RND15_52040, partial [Streptomyces sp. DSM 41529]|nr:hypothetical protein [Streptomyces sp. DSM 41529]